MNNIKKTVLYTNHIKAGAYMSEFGGWEMPIYYESILAEQKHCRKKAAVFDISHMGEFIFKGNIKESNFDKAFTRPLSDLKTGKSRYALILNKNGGVEDDIIAFKLAADEVMVATNASTVSKDFMILKKSIVSGRLGKISDISQETAKIDLQGPESRDILKKIIGENIDLHYFNFKHFNYNGQKILISRTGYTGELGYEIFLPANSAGKLWEEFTSDKFTSDKEVKPAGLGARDILRLEMGYSLYGHELSEDITPLEADLEFAVDFNHDFRGKEALVKQKNFKEEKKGISRKKIAFKTKSKRSPRRGWNILNNDNNVIGKVSSGSFSPSLNCGIGLGFIKRPFVLPGKNIIIKDSRGKGIPSLTVKLPFYSGGSVQK